LPSLSLLTTAHYYQPHKQSIEVFTHKQSIEVFTHFFTIPQRTEQCVRLSAQHLLVDTGARGGKETFEVPKDIVIIFTSSQRINPAKVRP
jgi:hypothetical protein